MNVETSTMAQCPECYGDEAFCAECHALLNLDATDAARCPSCEAKHAGEVMTTCWGQQYGVKANWAQASCPVQVCTGGTWAADPHGRQVANFRHESLHALTDWLCHGVPGVRPDGHGGIEVDPDARDPEQAEDDANAIHVALDTAT